MAAVARDISGFFLGASTVVFTGVSDPETLEILACREGLALASDLLISKARVASDCVNAVNSLQGEGMGQYGPLLERSRRPRQIFKRSSSSMKEGSLIRKHTSWQGAPSMIHSAAMFGSVIRLKAFVL